MREKITIYFPGNGTAVIRYRKGIIPDSETVNRVAHILNEYKRAGEQMFASEQLEADSAT